MGGFAGGGGFGFLDAMGDAAMDKQVILVATTNPGKVREMRAMLDADVDWKTLADFPDLGEVEEDGATFTENARKKATEYARATGLWTLADDSGLVVDALDGAPGVKSARFSGDIPPGADRKEIDRRNIARLLDLLDGVAEEKTNGPFRLSSLPDEPRTRADRDGRQGRRADHRRADRHQRVRLRSGLLSTWPG